MKPAGKLCWISSLLCFLLWGDTNTENQKQQWWQMQCEVDGEGLNGHAISTAENLSHKCFIKIITFLFPASCLLQSRRNTTTSTQWAWVLLALVWTKVYFKKKVLRIGYVTENTVLTVHQSLVPKISIPMYLPQ